MPKTDRDIGATKGVFCGSLDDTPGALIQTGDTLLYGVYFANTVGGISYIQLFNKAAINEVTLGSTSPDIVFPVPTSGVIAVGFIKPIKFDKGLVAFSTTTATGSTAAVQHGTFIYA